MNYMNIRMHGSMIKVIDYVVNEIKRMIILWIHGLSSRDRF